MLGEPEQHAGQDPRTAGGRRGDDHAHGRVHFLHRERRGENIGEDGSGERTHRPVKLRGVATDQAADAPQVARQAASNRVSHDLKRTRKGGLHLRPSAQAFGGFRDERQFAQRDPPRLRLLHRFDERVEHQAILGIERIMLTAGIARMASIACGLAG